jgi:hypothetical protein
MKSLVAKIWVFLLCTLVPGAKGASAGEAPLNSKGHQLWYRQPAENWFQAMPVGNGRLGAMVFGSIAQERIQLNENTLWSGNCGDFDREGAYRHLAAARQLLFDGKYVEAEALVGDEFMGERPIALSSRSTKSLARRPASRRCCYRVIPTNSSCSRHCPNNGRRDTQWLLRLASPWRPKPRFGIEPAISKRLVLHRIRPAFLNPADVHEAAKKLVPLFVHDDVVERRRQVPRSFRKCKVEEDFPALAAEGLEWSLWIR